MKYLFILSIMSTISYTASASTLQCKLIKIINGSIAKESKIIKISGNVDTTINDFEKSEKVIGQIRGSTIDDGALELNIFHTEKDVMAVAASTLPETTVQLYLDGNRYALTCWK